MYFVDIAVIVITEKRNEVYAVKRNQLIRTELAKAIVSCNSYAIVDYTPENLTELPIELKRKMTRAELVKYGLNGSIPADLYDR